MQTRRSATAKNGSYSNGHGENNGKRVRPSTNLAR